MDKRVKFEIHVKVDRGVKATKASLTRAVKAWIDGDDLPAGHAVSVIKWQNNNQKRRVSRDPDAERTWLGRLLPWATLQIQAVRENR